MSGWRLGRPWLQLIVRLALGGVFVWAGLAKLLDVRGFAVLISQYNLAPDWALAPLAVSLPILEVVAGLGLMLGLRGSLSTITALLLFFCGVLWFGVLQGLSVDCGCFSAEEQSAHDGLRQALARDLVMLAGAAFLYWQKRADRPGANGPFWRSMHNPWQTKENARS
jgi:uncharacterized membrane protein YphA (DoxX/SURF4 family)